MKKIFLLLAIFCLTSCNSSSRKCVYRQYYFDIESINDMNFHVTFHDSKNVHFTHNNKDYSVEIVEFKKSSQILSTRIFDNTIRKNSTAYALLEMDFVEINLVPTISEGRPQFETLFLLATLNFHLDLMLNEETGEYEDIDSLNPVFYTIENHSFSSSYYNIFYDNSIKRIEPILH